MLNTGNLLGKHRLSLEERGDDLYETSPVAVQALIKNVDLPQIIWEPACGKSCNIVTTLRNVGYTVIPTDLIDYKWSSDMLATGNLDFLKTTENNQIQAIVTNPPFKLAHEFVKHAREVSPLTMMLLRLAFIESVRRTDILDAGDLREVLVFKNRLPMMHLDGYEGKTSSSAMAFAWFIWDRFYSGFPTLKRISWEKNDGNNITNELQ